METTPETRTVLLLFRDFTGSHTVSTIARNLAMSRVGAWKLLKRLESEKLIRFEQVGKGRTNTAIIKLNLGEDVTVKYIAYSLARETSRYQRWKAAFEKLEKHLDFLIIYGSILTSPESANDIDILGVTSEGKDFNEIHRIIELIQKTQTRHIHAVNFTKEEFERELGKPNEAFIDAVRVGAVLYGQDKFIDFLKKFHRQK